MARPGPAWCVASRPVTDVRSDRDEGDPLARAAGVRDVRRRGNGARGDGSPTHARIGVERAGDGTLTIRLEGTWSLADGLPSTRAVDEALSAPAPPRSVAFDAARLVAWDSSAVLVLERIIALCRRRGIAVDFAGLPDAAHRLISLAEAVPEKRDARPPGTKAPWLDRVGQAATSAWEGARDTIGFFGETTIAFAALFRGRATFRARDLALVVEDCGP